MTAHLSGIPEAAGRLPADPPDAAPPAVRQPGPRRVIEAPPESAGGEFVAIFDELAVAWRQRREALALRAGVTS